MLLYIKKIGVFLERRMSSTFSFSEWDPYSMCSLSMLLILVHVEGDSYPRNAHKIDHAIPIAPNR